MYFDTNTPAREMLPTINQQVTRAVRRLDLKRPVRTSESDASKGRRIRRVRTARYAPRPDESGQLNSLAMNVATKLTKAAFNRYAAACDPWARRNIPSTTGVDPKYFAALVQEYVEQVVKPGNAVVVKPVDGQIQLRVHIRENSVGLTVQE